VSLSVGVMRFCRIAPSPFINRFELNFPYIPIYGRRICPFGIPRLYNVMGILILVMVM